jgi:hypothetical protein
LRLPYFSAGSHNYCFLKIMQDGSTSVRIYQACAMVTRRLPVNLVKLESFQGKQ